MISCRHAGRAAYCSYRSGLRILVISARFSGGLRLRQAKPLEAGPAGSWQRCSGLHALLWREQSRAAGCGQSCSRPGMTACLHKRFISGRDCSLQFCLMADTADDPAREALGCRQGSATGSCPRNAELGIALPSECTLLVPQQADMLRRPVDSPTPHHITCPTHRIHPPARNRRFPAAQHATSTQAQQPISSRAFSAQQTALLPPLPPRTLSAQ